MSKRHQGLDPGQTVLVVTAAASSCVVEILCEGLLEASVAMAASQSLTFGPYAAGDVVIRTTSVVGDVRIGAPSYPLSMPIGGDPVLVTVSRDFLPGDNGRKLKLMNPSLTLTLRGGKLPANFECTVIPNGTTSIAFADGANEGGVTTTQTRAKSSNKLFAIVSDPPTADTYMVTGS